MPTLAESLGQGYMDPEEVAAGGKIPVPQRSGSISTEKTISFDKNGKHYVIPTILGGVSYSPDAAISLWEKGKNPEVAAFGTQDEAVKFAEERSKALDKAFGGQGVLMKGPSDPAAGGPPMRSLREVLSGQKPKPAPMPPTLQQMMQTNPEAAKAMLAAMQAKKMEQMRQDEAARRSAAQFMGARADAPQDFYPPMRGNPMGRLGGGTR